MANLDRQKVNFDRNNRHTSILAGVEVSAHRNNGDVVIRINSNPDNGEETFRLTLTAVDWKKLSWLWGGAEI